MEIFHEKLEKNIKVKYSEWWRHYHNWNHIQKMLDKMYELNMYSDELYLAILFHDVVYDPQLQFSVENKYFNEQSSAEKFVYHLNKMEKGMRTKIENAILDTSKIIPETELGKQLCYFDRLILAEGSFADFVEYDNGIFKEYGFVDTSKYIKERSNLLKQLSCKKEFVDYFESKTYNIGIYAGSFNPFHKGHYNILQKAEKMFDKVIIAVGNNSYKSNVEKLELERRFPLLLRYNELVFYDGLLTDLIKEKQSNNIKITLIRGVRNSYDMHQEITMYRYLQDMMPDINMVTIYCDKEYDHISSSSIRSLDNMFDTSIYEL